VVTCEHPHDDARLREVLDHLKAYIEEEGLIGRCHIEEEGLMGLVYGYGHGYGLGLGYGCLGEVLDHL
jgi:hypothetical protein